MQDKRVDAALERRVGERVDLALEKIRLKIIMLGVAANWYLAKASEILAKPEELTKNVSGLDEVEMSQLVHRLPELIAQTKEQDHRCTEFWNASRDNIDNGSYRAEHSKLVILFDQFRFRPVYFEIKAKRFIRPLLRDAIRLLDERQDTSADAVTLEAVVRMRLREFVVLGEELELDYRVLDMARQELWTAHEWVARKTATSWLLQNRDNNQSPADTIKCALYGLKRAAIYYDYRRGYHFPTYAQWWIKDAVDKRKGL